MLDPVPSALRPPVPQTPLAPIVVARGLGKTYRLADKQPGLGGTLRHFLRRRHRDVPAVTDVSFTIQPGEIGRLACVYSGGMTEAPIIRANNQQPASAQEVH
jgi:hypothetical protein